MKQMISSRTDPMPDVAALRSAIRRSGKLLVAFSGGLDSTVLAKLAVEELGSRALAVTVDSETLPETELAQCRELTDELDIRHVVVSRSDLADGDFIRNPPNRCYFCRKGIAEILKRTAAENGIETIADGANLDDLDDYRPGLKAFEEAGIWHPFVEFSFRKTDVRALAHELDLSIRNKPSLACLASRFEYGLEITGERLDRVERAERFIRGLGFEQVRVRYFKNDIGKIEVMQHELDRLLEQTMRNRIVNRLKELGFRSVTVDLEGYRTGSMNIGLTGR